MKDKSLAVESAASALGLVPLVGPLLVPSGERLAAKIQEEWARNASKALKAAEGLTGLTREQLSEVIINDPKLLPLYVRLLYAAGMTGHDSTLAALGVAFGTAARARQRGDAPEVDQAELVLKALEDLGPHHFAVLKVLQEPRTAEEIEKDNYARYTPLNVSKKLGMDEATAAQCCMNLVNAGLATLLSLLEAFGYLITPLGEAVLRAVDAIQADSYPQA